MQPIRPEYLPPLSEHPAPIIIIGAGGIVRDAHLPAYRKAGFPVAAIVNRSRAHAEALARDYSIGNVYTTVEEAIATAPANVVYDVALPASLHCETLAKLPVGSSVLLQKPMGESLQAATEILDLSLSRSLNAAVNFQLRYAPAVIAARDLIKRGIIGELLDLEIRVAVETPWHLWPFLGSVPFAEFYYHSIHYTDLVRSFLGEPERVFARSIGHPDAPNMDGSRSTWVLDYGDRIRATITTNHHLRYGLDHQEAWIQWLGDRGAIRASLGVLMNYPHGVPDTFDVATFDNQGQPVWQRIDIPGAWFPDAFIGTMASVMRAIERPDEEPATSVRDAFRTMAVVDAACRSARACGVVPSQYRERTQ